MVCLLLVIMGILIVMIFALSAKIYFLHCGAKEIAEAFRDRLAADTNTLIDISTRDPYMRRLAAEINVQLRLLRKERRRCQQGDQELKTAVTNISHDLRTPLTAIRGYLDLLEREDTSENVQRYLAQVADRTEAMQRLTEELFRYSIVLSARDLDLVQVDLVAALETCLLSFYAAMQERGISPVLTLPEHPVVRTLDTGALNRIFSNIISNALKYADGDFAVSMTDDGRIIFSNTARDLDAVTVGRLFDRFFTVEASRNSTGLGLSIARALTEQMGGSIEAEYKHDTVFITVNFL